MLFYCAANIEVDDLFSHLFIGSQTIQWASFKEDKYSQLLVVIWLLLGCERGTIYGHFSDNGDGAFTSATKHKSQPDKRDIEGRSVCHTP